jgi:outer membrane protein OmpA-like peptidoglycan-associated protein
MRFLVGLLCALLTGCFKTTQKPNPKLEETIVEVAEPEELYEDVREEREIQEEVSVKNYGDLYTEADVRVRVYFDFDRYNLTEDDKIALNKLADELKQSEKKYILVVGHSDWRGATDYNERLGMRRAQTVEAFLREIGLVDNQLEVLSLGSTYAEPNLSKADAWKDRRCDILIK